ncbi:PH domain-containing protein [Pseudoxanthomonas sacheonensis]|uniref:Membrane protein n=1 Tax=Pseudoxanthomonas sacheonensis TaxID=443615 RepID=A0ABU1RTI7_9GAMM|nr:PH domain-containing protein [Pseudoxanthomonas sacheonensis]MDR6842088.1 putative membrane protein [Pseudoxanthomonas sacheonensis]
MQTEALGENKPERRLHPWSWLFVLVQQLKQFIVPLLALLVFGGSGGPGGVWAGIGPLIAVGVLVVISVLQYFTYRYRIGRDGLSIREGWLHRSLREIPYSRIHNVVLHQTVLHRLFGVAEVRLESAGGQKPEAQMRVLRLDEALALESLIKHRGQAPDADASAVQADSLLSLPTAEVIRLGLVSNRGMIVMAAAFGAAWQAFPDRMVADYFERFARQLFGYASHLQYGWITTAAAALALLLLASLLLRLLSVLLALVQYHGFRLSEEQRRLTVERGLLSKLRTSVARRRIQAWTLHEGFLHRLLKRRSLRIDTAVAEQQGKNDQRALKELAPIATPDACDALIQHLLPQAQWPRSEWTVLPAGVWWRIFLPTLIFIVILALALASYFQNAWGLAPLLWLPWSAFAAIQQARRAGYAVDDRLVAIRGGWWSRYWRFAEIDKLQALRLVRSPMDRRMGTASLWLDTAGASGLAPPLRIRFLPEADARLLYLQLSQALVRRRLRW